MKKLFFLYLVIASAIIRPCSAHVVVAHHHYTYTPGFGITYRGNTLRGYFLLNQKYVIYSVEKYGRRSNVTADFFKTVYLSLSSQKVLNTNGLIEYDYIAQFHSLLRKIYAGKNTWFDRNLSYSTTGNIYDVVIDSNGTYILTEPIPSFHATKRVLTDYLNTCYHPSFKREHFRDSIDVIGEIEKRS